MNLTQFLTPAVACRPDLSLAEVAEEMDQHNVGSVVVVDITGRIIGIVTDRDIALRGMGERRDPSTTVDQVMTPDVVSIRGNADVFDVARQMADAQCRRLPVVGPDGTLKGVVALDDLVVLFAHQTDNLANVIAAEMTPR